VISERGWVKNRFGNVKSIVIFYTMFETPSTYKLVKEIPGKMYMYSYIVKNASYSVYFEHLQQNIYSLNFILHSHAGTTHITTDVVDVGTDISIGVFGTLMEVMRHFVDTYNPRGIEFRSEETFGDTRANLYKALLKKYLPDTYKMATVFTITRK
jgi:hypothetical protein